ncbi:MAG: hypothetical protein RJB60_2730 [Pseudomonadota bacterium]|jgi:hypothetical protein
MTTPAWIEQLQPASFKGVRFHVDSVEWTAGDNVVVREYPFQDRPTVFRMGKAAQTLKFSAYVIGDDYIAQRDELAQALTGDGDLVHPTAGTMRAFVAEKFRVSEAPTSEGGIARFDLSFVLAEPRRYPVAVANTGGEAVAAAQQAKEAAVDEFASKFSVANAPGWVAENVVDRINTTMASVMGPIQEAASQINEFSSQVVSSYQALQSSVNSLVAAPRALAGAIAGLFSLPGDLSAAAARLFSGVFEGVFDLPSKSDQERVELPTTAKQSVFKQAHEPKALAVGDMWLYTGSMNNFKWSESTNWANFNDGATMSAAALVTPDGNTNAVKIVELGTNAPHYVDSYQAFGAGPGAYVMSAFAKKGERSGVILCSYSQVNNHGAWFDLDAGQVSNVSSGDSAEIIYVGGGWFRCILRIANQSNVAGPIQRIYAWDTTQQGGSSYQGTAGAGVHVWGLMLEPGSVATKYIPTGNAVVSNVGINQAYAWNGAAWVLSAAAVGPSQAGVGLIMSGAGAASLQVLDAPGQLIATKCNAAFNVLIQSLALASLVEAQTALGDAAPDAVDVTEAHRVRAWLYTKTTAMLMAASSKPGSSAGTSSAWHDAMLAMLSASLAEMRSRAGGGSRIDTYTPNGWEPVWQISYRLYGTADFADEILAMNPHITNPLLVPPGRALTVVRHG